MAYPARRANQNAEREQCCRAGEPETRQRGIPLAYEHAQCGVEHEGVAEKHGTHDPARSPHPVCSTEPVRWMANGKPPERHGFGEKDRGESWGERINGSKEHPMIDQRHPDPHAGQGESNRTLAVSMWRSRRERDNADGQPQAEQRDRRGPCRSVVAREDRKELVCCKWHWLCGAADSWCTRVAGRTVGQWRTPCQGGPA